LLVYFTIYMQDIIMSRLRDKDTGTADFRANAQKMAHILAGQAIVYLKKKKIDVATPLAKTIGYMPGQDVVLVPILRAGLAFLPVFLYYFESAKVGFIGLKRDEKTAVAKEYYRNLPAIRKNDLVIILDPMLATGGSAVSAVKILLSAGVKQEQILSVFLVAAPEGYRKLRRQFPKIKIIIGTKDKKLTRDKFIWPGLGDFGDRYFGTKRRH
jgi:uracil phosphoribosyltransferase